MSLWTHSLAVGSKVGVWRANLLNLKEYSNTVNGDLMQPFKPYISRIMESLGNKLFQKHLWELSQVGGVAFAGLPSS